MCRTGNSVSSMLSVVETRFVTTLLSRNTWNVLKANTIPLRDQLMSWLLIIKFITKGTDYLTQTLSFQLSLQPDALQSNLFHIAVRYTYNTVRYTYNTVRYTYNPVLNTYNNLLFCLGYSVHRTCTKCRPEQEPCCTVLTLI